MIPDGAPEDTSGLSPRVVVVLDWFEEVTERVPLP